MGLKKQSLCIFLLVIFISLGVEGFVYARNVVVLVGKENRASSLALKKFKSVYKGSLREHSLERALLLTRDYTVYQKIKAKLRFADLVLVIGEEAAKFVQKSGLNSPVVFILINEPEKYGFTSGVSLTPSVGAQLGIFRKLLPDVKRIGVIYNSERSREIVDEAKKEAGVLGLEIVALEADSKGQVAEVVRALEGKIDAFWMLNDPLVANAVVLQRLLLFTLTYRIPLIVPTPSMVEKGALLSLSAAYGAMGEEAGEIVNQIISGKDPVEIGIRRVENAEFTLNLKTARAIELSMPQAIISQAVRVYK